MSKNRKNRRKSRNRISAAATIEPSSTRVDNASSTSITTVATGSLSPSRHESDNVNVQESNPTNIKRSTINESDKKRKDVHAMTSTNDASFCDSDLQIHKKTKKRRRTTPESLPNQNGIKWIEDSTGRKECESNV